MRARASQVEAFKQAMLSTKGRGYLVHWGGCEKQLVEGLGRKGRRVRTINGLGVCRYAFGASGNGGFPDMPALPVGFSLSMDLLALLFGFTFTHGAEQDVKDQLVILTALLHAFREHFISVGQEHVWREDY